jgi:predicted ATP-dependent endonuclease of OLD family
VHGYPLSIVILLDEPGLTLHGKAQPDLFRYIKRRLLPTHQVIYSTHSPLMVPSDRLSNVLIVEDIVQRDERNGVVELVLRFTRYNMTPFMELKQ